MPPNVDYRLTPDGEKVAEAVKALILALYGVMPHVMKARATVGLTAVQPALRTTPAATAASR